MEENLAADRFFCSIVESVKYQAKPMTIYASTKTEEALLSALQRNGLACKL